MKGGDKKSMYFEMMMVEELNWSIRDASSQMKEGESK